jgi:hypothetical protein
VLAIDLAVIAAVWYWSRSREWNMRHKLALASGAALAYAWHAFFETPAVGGATSPSVRIGNVIFAAGVIVLIVVAAMRNRSSARGWSSSKAADV